MEMHYGFTFHCKYRLEPEGSDVSHVILIHPDLGLVGVG